MYSSTIEQTDMDILIAQVRSKLSVQEQEEFLHEIESLEKSEEIEIQAIHNDFSKPTL